MDITYDEKEDILFIRFNNKAIVRDISYGWNVNVGLTDSGVGQITILEAKVAGLLPINLPKEITSLTTLDSYKKTKLTG